MTRLNGKTVLVTGACAAFGAAIATRIADEGAAVVVHDHFDLEAACRIAAVIVSRGGRAIAVCGDVTKADDVRRIFHSAADVFGTPAIIVNNIARREDDTADDIFGTFMICQEAGRHLTFGGVIINVHEAVDGEAADAAAFDTLSLGLLPEFDLKGIRIVSLGARERATADTSIASTVAQHAAYGAKASRRPAASIEIARSLASRRPAFSPGWRGW